MRALFITWDGPEQNYLESLFFPILARLQSDDLRIDVLQFTWASEPQLQSIRAAALRAGIRYTHRYVWRRPLVAATASMIAYGAREVARYARSNSIDVLLPRSIIAGAMTLLARRFLPGSRLLFDADGLMADERLDFSGWSASSPAYRVLRRVERQCLREADVVVTRTRPAKEILSARAGPHLLPQRIYVIPNAKDESIFHPGDALQRARLRAELGVPDDAPLIVYAGSLGPHYHATEMFRLFGFVQRRRPRARFVVLTGSHARLDWCREQAGVPESCVRVARVPPGEVASYLAAADLGISFRTPSLSQRAVSPIKVGEYLLCGVPVVSTCGIGDLDKQLSPDVARLVADLEDDTLQGVADWLIDIVLPDREGYRKACRARGLAEFALDACVARYRSAIEVLGARRTEEPKSIVLGW